MEIEYDPVKSQRNIHKHGVSFEAVHEFEFDSALEEIDDRWDYGEQRIRATGYVGQRLYHLTYTHRGGVLRVISFRKANHREVGRYAKA